MFALVNTPNGTAPVELRELPEPQPARNEALVEVRAFSLNRGELRSFRNNEEGWVPGQDVAGVVLHQAANGEGPPAGARVVALMDEFGWAQRAAVPTHRMTVLPDSVSLAQAATLPVAGLTALRTLRHGAPLLAKRVLITGAAGGVGTLAVQLAVRSGARVTAVVGRPDRAAGLRDLGALEVIQGIDTAQGRFGLILNRPEGRRLRARSNLSRRREPLWYTAIRRPNRPRSALPTSGVRRIPVCRASVISRRRQRIGLRRTWHCWSR